VAEVEELEGRLKVIMRDHETDPSGLAVAIVQSGLRLVGLEEDQLGLEEVFMRVTRGDTQ